MNSTLFKKLTELKKKELINKNEQQIIETKIKKENGFEYINNLKLQINNFEKNIKGKIIQDNKYIVEWQNEKDFNKERNTVDKLKGNISNEEYHKINTELYNKKNLIDGNKINQRYSNKKNNITVREFISNLDLVDDDTKDTFIKNKKYNKNGWISGLSMKEMIEIPHKIKIYNDIIPIFKSIINIIEKQKTEINILKKKINSQ
jgi:hypothetical protein